MSAFSFINNSKSTNNASNSPHSSTSLVEDLYDSQHLHTFVNQSKTFSSPSPQQQRARKHNSSSSSSLFQSPSPRNSGQPLVKSYFSFIDDLDLPPSLPKNSSNSSRTSSPDPFKNSAFSLSSKNFNTKSETYSSPDVLAKSVFAFINSDSPSPSPRQPKIKPNNELKFISANTSLHRLQTEKTNQLNGIQRFYTKQLQVYDQISTLKSKIELVQNKMRTALATEDFLVAETLQQQEQKMMQSLSELMQQNALGKQIYSGWQRVYALGRQEAEAAQHVITCCQQVKEERHVQYTKFLSDKEKMHDQKLQAIDEQRATIESEKSELAFDLGLWEQTEQDLVEREEDAVHEEVQKKKDLEAQTQLVRNEIKELAAKLKSLEIKKAELLANTVEVDLSIQEKLKPFANERLEHEQELETIEIRKRDIEDKAAHLDQLDTQVNTEMRRHQEEKERGLEEMCAFDEQITTATETANSQQADVLNDVLKKMEARDEQVIQHKTEIQKSREFIQSKRKEIESIQHALYDQQQMKIHTDETILEMQQKLKSLARHKQLAIEAGRFQNAAAWTNQIKGMEKEVAKLKESDEKEDNEGLEERLVKGKHELSLLEKQHAELEKRKNAEIKLILENFIQDELNSKSANDKVIQSMIEHESKIISVQLKVLYQQQEQLDDDEEFFKGKEKKDDDEEMETKQSTKGIKSKLKNRKKEWAYKGLK